MKRLVSLVTVFATFLALLSIGISNVSADGPSPVEQPAKPVRITAAKVKPPRGVSLSKNSMQSVVLSLPRGEPSLTAAAVNVSSGSFYVSSAWTTDGSGNSKSSFNPGDSIEWVGSIANGTGGNQTAYFVWSVSGPCGSGTLWSGNLTTGSWNWYLGGTIPGNACGGTYNYNLSVTFNGSTTSKSASYTVNGGSVSLSAAQTADGNGNSKTTFNTGDSIRWIGNIYNGTGSYRTVYTVWSVSGPCGSSTLWSGSLSTGPGTWGWYIGNAIPANACAGNYTFTVSMTYNGSTSSKSASYQVNGSGSISILSAWTADGSGNNKTAFNSGDSILWEGVIYNGTGSSKTAFFTWAASGPCGSSTLWSGNLTVSPGSATWYLSGTIPNNCAGSYTFTLSTTNSSKSSQYSVASGAVSCSCVKYILNRFNLGANMGGTGLAKDMGSLLRAKSFTQIYTPTAGAVVIFKPAFGHGVDSSAGHVGVIVGVSSTSTTWTINIQDANWQGDTSTASGCRNVGFHPFTYSKSFGTAQIEYWMHP